MRAWEFVRGMPLLALLACAGSRGPVVELTAVPEAWMRVPSNAALPSREVFTRSRHHVTDGFEFDGNTSLAFASTLEPGTRLVATLRGSLQPGAGLMLVVRGEAADTVWSWTAAAEAPTPPECAVVVKPDAHYWGGAFLARGPAGSPSVRVERLRVEMPAAGLTPPSIILLTLDTFRADHLSCVSPSAPLTPTLDSLALAGTLFTTAVATSQATTPSHISIMTGLYCFAHGVYQNSRGVSDQAVTLAELLGHAGYRTMGAVSVTHLNPDVANLGQGFELFLPSRWPGPEGEPADLRTTEVVRALLTSRDSRPLFLWVHYFDPHTPYSPPQEVPLPAGVPRLGTVRYADGMGMVRHDSLTGQVLDPDGEIARYRGEVAFLDAEIGRLLNRLRLMGMLDRAVVAVAGDHGEGLGEHGVYFEHAGMYEPILRVPLILSGYGIPAGERIDARVSTVSLMPTLATLAGIGDLPPCYGRNLIEEVRRRREATDEPIFAESSGRKICAAWEGSRKLIWVPGSKQTDWTMPQRVMFFDLADDPAESRNALEGNEEAATRLRDLWGDHARTPLVRLQPREGSADIRKLEALGYVQ